MSSEEGFVQTPRLWVKRAKAPTWSQGCRWTCWFLLRPPPPRSYSGRASRAEPQRRGRPESSTWCHLKTESSDQTQTQRTGQQGQDHCWFWTSFLYWRIKVYITLYCFIILWGVQAVSAFKLFNLFLLFWNTEPLRTNRDPEWVC